MKRMSVAEKEETLVEMDTTRAHHGYGNTNAK